VVATAHTAVVESDGRRSWTWRADLMEHDIVPPISLHK
jgi:hypothetical protein